MYIYRNSIFLSEGKNGNVIEEENFIMNGDTKYYLKYLNKDIKSSKGGNSSVFLLYKKDDTAELAIKISKHSRPKRGAREDYIRRYGRFIEEINVLNELKDKGKENIVAILFDGVLTLEDREFPYYVMEKADTDLKEYVFGNKEIDIQEKVKFCVNVFDAVKQLHSEGYYHRDIKPDNILLFYESGSENTKAVWKIGDLGLMAHRDKDYDDLGEKVGPFGWLSPEAANKFLTEKASLGFDCKIDGKSDVFQLGKLFWFIFQGNIPIGQLKNEDFIPEIPNKDYIFYMIQEMLIYSKEKRISLDDLDGVLSELKLSFAV